MQNIASTSPNLLTAPRCRPDRSAPHPIPREDGRLLLRMIRFHLERGRWGEAKGSLNYFIEQMKEGQHAYAGIRDEMELPLTLADLTTHQLTPLLNAGVTHVWQVEALTPDELASLNRIGERSAAIAKRACRKLVKDFRRWRAAQGGDK